MATSNSSNSNIPTFDKMQRLKEVYKALENTTNFLRPALPFINSHLTEFFASSYWENIIPSNIRKDLDSKSVEEVKDLMKDYANGKWIDYSQADLLEDSNFTNVKTFKDLMICCGKLRLSHLGMTLPLQDVCVGGRSIHEIILAEHGLKFDAIMSAKKMHEVEVMSDLIMKLAHTVQTKDYSSSSSRINYLVDVGSGKGYLSSFLTLMHKFKVLAVDSSSINTSGCEKRSAKLEKVWSQLVRRAIERKEFGQATKRGKRKKGYLNSMRDRESSLVNQTNNLSISTSDNEEVNETTLDCNKFLQTMTQFVSLECDLEQCVKEYFPCYLSPKDHHAGFGIIGLHTCGNLGVDSLRLFLLNENAKFICNVPCCYHFLDENPLLYPSKRFEGSRILNRNKGEMVDSIMKPTFPLSKILNSEEVNQFCIGRNARMMCAYSVERMVKEEKGLDMHPSILYRSILQLLIKQNLPSFYQDMDDYHYSVGKIGDKCKNFVDYCRRGLENLRLGDSIHPSDDEITNLYRTFEHQGKENLHKYYLMRSIFAPLVEECILLDRLAFLLEHDSVAEAYILKVFDASVSPRSHALFAVKR